jgi:hypothetical protein
MPGDVLICRLGDPVGRACLAPNLGVRMIASVDVCILKPNESAIAAFLVYAMSSPVYLEWIGSLVRGSTRDRVSRSMLGRFCVPLPPLPEQPPSSNTSTLRRPSSTPPSQRHAAKSSFCANTASGSSPTWSPARCMCARSRHSCRRSRPTRRLDPRKKSLLPKSSQPQIRKKSPMAKSKSTSNHQVIREPLAARGGEIVLYQAPDGSVKLDVRLERGSIWLSLNQMALLFDTERSVITKHLRNIFQRESLKKKAMCKKCTFPVRTSLSRSIVWTPSSRSVTGSTPSAAPSSVSGLLRCCATTSFGLHGQCTTVAGTATDDPAGLHAGGPASTERGGGNRSVAGGA